MKYLLENTTTERLRFRLLDQNDWQTWLEFFKDPTLGKYWKSSISDPAELCNRWFDKNFNRYVNDLGGMNVLEDHKTGEFIGQCGLLIQSVEGKTELELAYSIMPVHRNKGYASEAARKCINQAFDCNWSESLISIIHEENIESEKVALKNNLTLHYRTMYDNNPVKIYRITKTKSQSSG